MAQGSEVHSEGENRREHPTSFYGDSADTSGEFAAARRMGWAHAATGCACTPPNMPYYIRVAYHAGAAMYYESIGDTARRKGFATVHALPEMND